MLRTEEYMSNPLLISIIIPVYKVEPYLRECIDSIVKQPFNDYEVILIDDGSTDGSPAICDDYARRFPQLLVIHQKNAGVSAARNAGLDIAKGEWIWFVDADDMIMNGQMLENLLEIKADLIMFGYQELLDNKIVGTATYDDCKDMTKDRFLESHVSYFVWNMLFRRDIIEKYHLRFTEGVRMGEDLEFQYKYLIHSQHPISLSTQLYIYRKREGSAVNNSKSRNHAVTDGLVILKNLLDYIQQYSAKEAVWIDLRLQGLMKSLLYSAYHAGDVLSHHKIQKDVRDTMDSYKKIGFHTFETLKMRLAYCNVYLYYMLNYIYLKIKQL